MMISAPSITAALGGSDQFEKSTAAIKRPKGNIVIRAMAPELSDWRHSFTVSFIL
jgi:hypothetical protein